MEGALCLSLWLFSYQKIVTLSRVQFLSFSFIHFIKYLLLSGMFLRVVDSTDRHGPCPQKALKKALKIDNYNEV